MNLLEEKWLPIRRRNGQVDWVAPHQITESDIVAFAANRADFNGALAQMMIGLLQTTTSIEDEGDWEDLSNKPPSAEALQRWFAPTVEAFELDGDGARFMQDSTLEISEKDQCSIDGLFMEAPGENTLKENTDHFFKRGTIASLCPHCVATALFSLQLNSPAGGNGHRTGVRGGGPLTTLVVATPSRKLWNDLWLNVRPRRLMLQEQGNVNKTELHFTFPWLKKDIAELQALGQSKKKKEEKLELQLQPIQMHPTHIFWTMPRRILLHFGQEQSGVCDVCKRVTTMLVSRYATKNQGLNYKGTWRHPFSPYYESSPDEWLPVHPQPSGFSYQNWVAWVLGDKRGKKHVRPALVINHFLQERRKYQASGQFRLWVFGFDMKNDKARCWYETTFPLYGFAENKRETQIHIQSLVSEMVASAEITIDYLSDAIKEAWFPKRNGKVETRGDLSFVDKAFWDSTERDFYQQLKDLFEQARSNTGIDMDDANYIIGLGEAWLKVLRDKALQLFDVDIVGAGAISQQDPRRIAEAYNSLKRNLNGNAIRAILRLPVADKPEKGSKGLKAGIKKAKPSTEPQAQQPL
jgi:CRISPR system Cascade subunit CasA